MYRAVLHKKEKFVLSREIIIIIIKTENERFSLSVRTGKGTQFKNGQ